MKGKIQKLIYDRNYGFIKTEDGKEEVFFHKKDLENGIVFDALQKGQKVRFFIEETDKGKKATHIITSN